VALVDGNIARLLARVFGVREAIDGAGLRKLWELAAGLQPEKGGRLFNGGLMEIGALVCVPRGPRCAQCPVAEFCAAASAGAQGEIPVKKARRKTVRMEERCALMMRDGEVLLEHQRGTRWRGLWKLPKVEEIPERKPELVIEYPFTHHRVRLSVYRMRTPRVLQAGWEWFAIEGIKEVPMAAGHRKALAEIMSRAKRDRLPIKVFNKSANYEL
jgi:A/G-specific adenine glycosylase